MAKSKAPKKPTLAQQLAETQAQFQAFKTAVQEYVQEVRFPTVTEHSRTNVLFKKGEVTGKGTVSIEELVTTVAAGQVLGYDTVLRNGNSGPMGRELIVYYIKNRSQAPDIEGLYTPVVPPTETKDWEDED